MSDLEPGVPPTIDDVNVGPADLAAQPETVVGRIGHYSKAIAAGAVGLACTAALVITGSEVDPEVSSAAQTVLAAALVYWVRNR